MANPSKQSKGKILLVDDDPGLLRLLSIRLRAEGYDVAAVESAHKALATLNRFSPDLVITDLRMDKMDGIGLLKELQTRSPGMRVVISVTTTMNAKMNAHAVSPTKADMVPTRWASTCRPRRPTSSWRTLVRMPGGSPPASCVRASW